VAQSNGSDTIVKYKIEWDLNAAFNSNGGSPVGFNHKMVSPSQDCTVYHCSFNISGLQKGVPYYVCHVLI
jgi:hypothetical protein